MAQVPSRIQLMYKEDPDDQYYSIELNIHGIRAIHDGLCQAVDKWAGGDPIEQENMISMRDNFYRLLLEHSFENISLD